MSYEFMMFKKHVEKHCYCVINEGTEIIQESSKS